MVWVWGRRTRAQKKKGKGKDKDKGGDSDEEGADEAPTRWNDYDVKFHFPEPTELSPPLMQLMDVKFGYPGRADFGLSDINVGIDMVRDHRLSIARLRRVGRGVTVVGGRRLRWVRC